MGLLVLVRTWQIISNRWSTRVSAFLCYVEWHAPWRFTLENLLDPMHGTFLHHESHSMSKGETSARSRIRETDRGFFFEKTNQRGVNFYWAEFCRPASTGST